jgi:hypothetical protein
MPIQFRCQECSKAVEVDAEFALRSAQCPYCNAVVSVPSASTLTGGPGAPSSPHAAGDWDAPVASSPPPPPPRSDDGGMPPSLHIGPAGDRKQRTARRLAIISLVLGIVAVTSNGIALVLASSIMYPIVKDNPDLATFEQQYTEELQAQLRQHPRAPWVGVFFAGGSLLAIVGLACGFASLRFSSRNKTAWIGVLLTGPCALCFGTGIVLSIAQGLA